MIKLQIGGERFKKLGDHPCTLGQTYISQDGLAVAIILEGLKICVIREHTTPYLTTVGMMVGLWRLCNLIVTEKEP